MHYGPNMNTMAKSKSGSLDLDTVDASLSAVRRSVAEIESKLRMARGTRRVPTILTETVQTQPTLLSRIATLLRTDPLDTVELTAKLGASAAKVRRTLASLREQKLVFNIGSDVEPKWVHVLGDNGTAAELRAWVLRLIALRPFTHRELVTMTAARENRISGVLADLREDAKTRVINLGDGSRGRWFVLPLDVKIATLRRP